MTTYKSNNNFPKGTDYPKGNVPNCPNNLFQILNQLIIYVHFQTRNRTINSRWHPNSKR